MGEVINLRLARKARTRSAAQGQAAANRAKFGRTAGEKALEKAERARAAKLLADARRDMPEA